MEKEEKINKIVMEIVELISSIPANGRKLTVFKSIKKCILENEEYFDLDLIYELCKEYSEYTGLDVSDLIQEIIDSKSAKHNYLVAKNIKNIDADQKILHEKIVIESKNAKYCYLYAKDVVTANIKALEEATLKAKDPKYSYFFAKDIAGTDIDKHRQVILDSKNAEYNFLFAYGIPYSNYEEIYKHGQAIIDSKNIEYCLKYRENFPVNGSLAENLQKLAIEEKNAHLCYMLALNVADLDNKALGNAAMSDTTEESAKWNFQFAAYIKNADINGHAKAVIKSGNLKYNYMFAKDVPGADVLAHGNVVLASGDNDYNLDFAKDVPGADILSHLKVVESNKCSDGAHKEVFEMLTSQAQGIQKIKQLILNLNNK